MGQTPAPASTSWLTDMVLAQPMRNDQPMSPTPNEIEAGLSLPDTIVDPALERVANQDHTRGDWTSPREATQPNPPWPDEDNPMMRFLLAKAIASVEAGMERDIAMLQLAAHAWFEGGIEGYDRGQRDARRPRAV
jgi:hypothetical protein